MEHSELGGSSPILHLRLKSPAIGKLVAGTAPQILPICTEKLIYEDIYAGSFRDIQRRILYFFRVKSPVKGRANAAESPPKKASGHP